MPATERPRRNNGVMASKVTSQLLEFIDRSPSPYHAAENAAGRLTDAGYRRYDPADEWTDLTGGGYVLDGGSLIAWWIPQDATARTPVALVGAHTDSPNLRVKVRPDTGRAGWRQLGVDVYGGALVNSWLDRDLGLSGRVVTRSPEGLCTQLVKVDRPILRVPQLAIHLDREIVEKGLLLDKQAHLAPVWGLGEVDEGGFVRFLADELMVEPDEILHWDVMAHDLTPGTVLGASGEMIAAGRLDNLHSCFCAVEALIGAPTAPSGGPVRFVALFDHEEIGSGSATGASSRALQATLERTVTARGGTTEDVHRAVAGSLCVSADMAHGVHPNYLDRHEPEHHVQLNGGPVIKHNANVRYATDAVTAARFTEACDRAGVPVQSYVHRSNLACGSTIGPITAARLGMDVVDVGSAQLSMHSARELAGADDPEMLVAALREVFVGV